MGTIIDHRYDVSQQTLFIATNRLSDKDFSARVRTYVTKVASTEKTARTRVFADPEHSLFPVDSMEDTVLSKIYFDYQHEKIAEYRRAVIADKLATYLNLYDVPDALFTYGTVKEAAATDAVYLLPSMKLCKIASAQDLGEAALLFDRENTKLNVVQRIEFAVNFIKAASEFAVTSYPVTIAKYAGTLDTDIESLQAMLEYRAAAATMCNKSGAAYTKLASELKAINVLPTRAECTKLASLIHKLDEVNGFTNASYDHRMPCAYSIVFNKTAEVTELGMSASPSKAELIASYGDGVLDVVEDESGNIDEEKVKQLRGEYDPLN